jgi:pimeloyl-ACP methyl ester carboxylesterase
LQEPFGTDYMHDEGREALPEVLAALEIENPVLVGHSDGASIALLHAGAGPSGGGPGGHGAARFVEDISIRSIAAAKVAFETTDLPAKLGKYHRDVRAPSTAGTTSGCIPISAPGTSRTACRSIACPILAIQGEDDEYGTMAQVEAIRGAAPGSAPAGAQVGGNRHRAVVLQRGDDHGERGLDPHRATRLCR